MDSSPPKAMVVVASRVEAVRWQLAIQKYITDRGYKIRALVAFSGEVSDKESGPDGFTEHSPVLNPNLKGRDIREAFKGDEYQISFKAYHTTAELSATTDPNLVFNLRAKLDAAGHYDNFEIDRVVAVELKPGAI